MMLPNMFGALRVKDRVYRLGSGVRHGIISGRFTVKKVVGGMLRRLDRLDA